MADRPILFSAPMVRALLDGRKSQTRRVLKRQPYTVEGVVFTWEGRESSFLCGPQAVGANLLHHGAAHYAPGDRLWVREAWRVMDGQDKFSGARIAEQCLEAGYKRSWAPIQYEADGARDNWIADPHTFGTKAGRYRHARFMPRWASRLTLTVTNVRVERLQDISEADAIAEGVEAGATSRGTMWMAYGEEPNCWVKTARTSFIRLWNSLHGPDSWDANPWVAAISFDVRRGNIDEAPK